MTFPQIEFPLTDTLKQAGIRRIAKEGLTVVIQHGEANTRIMIYRDWHKTTKKLRKELQDVCQPDIVKEIETTMSKHYLELLTAIGTSATGDPIDEVAAVQTKADIPFEEWQAELTKKYALLKQTIEQTLSNVWYPVEFALSVKSILNIGACDLPFAGIILGAPSSGKTLAIELFRKWPRTFYTDSFSAKSFVSHSTGVTKEQLPDIDLLPKIKDKFFLTPELAPTFAAKEDDLIQVLGIMTRILDGRGYESDSGAHGHRGYNESMMFAWIGAAVDIPRKVHKVLGTLGPKLYFIRMPKTNKNEDDYLAQLQKDEFVNQREAIRKAILDYLKWFESCPTMEHENGLPKMQWDSAKDQKEALKVIVKLAKLLAHLRGVIPTWETHDSQGSDYAYTIATIEEPDRAMTQLRNLARGHALSLGRNFITMEDIGIVVKVVLSTAVLERVKVFDLLVQHGGILTTSQITEALNTSNPTARRTMAEFKALGLVIMEQVKDGNNNPVMQIRLKSEFDYFLKEDFQQLRKGFELADYTEYLNAKGAEIEAIIQAKASAKETLFKEICKQIAAESKDADGIIDHDYLHRQLVTSGKFDSGEGTALIQDQLKTRYLQEIEYHTYMIATVAGDDGDSKREQGAT